MKSILVEYEVWSKWKEKPVEMALSDNDIVFVSIVGPCENSGAHKMHVCRVIYDYNRKWHQFIDRESKDIK